MEQNEEEFWLAYYLDRSNFAVFSNELDCLRHAVEFSMLAKKIVAGEEF